MSKAILPIDISNMPELRHLAEEVLASKKPRIVKVHGETLALVTSVKPTAKRGRKREKTNADFEAFLSTAGGLKGLVDTEELKKDIYESRKIITRPPIEL
jgi:hypothetical protein